MNITRWSTLKSDLLYSLQPKMEKVYTVNKKRPGAWSFSSRKLEIPGVIGNFGFGVQNEAEQKLTVLPREHTGHSKHPLPTMQEMTLHMDISK